MSWSAFAEVAFEGLFSTSRFLRAASFLNVDQPHEHQVGDLLNDRQRVGDAALPEFGPEFVDVVF